LPDTELVLLSPVLHVAYDEDVRGAWAYAALAVGLVLFGIVGLFSIGAPFLLTGLAMLVCFPWRRRPDVLWPALAGVWGLTLGYILVAPLSCTSTDVGTTCNGLLLDYSGGPSYNAPLLPALLVGLATAVASGLLVRMLVRRRRRTSVGS
jgi:formate-dependent nitrite reductase membrane component NrfD